MAIFSPSTARLPPSRHATRTRARRAMAVGRPFALLVALAAVVAAATGNDVEVLTDATFDARVAEADIILVEFYAPWCGHCKKLAPEYEVAATKLLQNDPPVPLAKLDATENGQSASKHGVTGYPTMKVFRKGQASDYSGPRDAAGIVSYMQKQARPASAKLASADALNAFVAAAADTVVVGVFADPSGAAHRTWASTTGAMRDDFAFAEVSVATANAAKSLKNQKFAEGADSFAVVLPPRHVAGKEDAVFVSADFGALRAFVAGHSLSVVGHVTPDTLPRYKRAGKPLVTLFYGVDFDLNLKGTKYIANRLRKLAASDPAFSGFSFAVANLASNGRALDSKFGLVQATDFVVTVEDLAAGTKYRSEALVSQPANKFSAMDLAPFLRQILAGEIEPYIKSEAPPEDNSGPVTVVTAKTFAELVDDESKDVLIEFYAPWCGHCKSLAPKWDELGAAFKDVDSVVIAKMDATANDVDPRYAVSGFPTLFFAKGSAGGKASPVKYSGGREVAEFKDYILKNAHHKVDKAKVKDEL